MAGSVTYQYKRLGEILVESGYLTDKEIESAIALQKTENKPLGQILVEKGYVTWNDIANAVSKQYNMKVLESVQDIEIKSEILQILSKHNTENWRVVPFEKNENNILKLLTDQTSNLAAIKRDIQFMTGLTPEFVIVSTPNLDYLLKEHYGSNIKAVEELKDVLDTESKENIINLEDVQLGSEDQVVTEESGPIIKLVNELISGAMKQEASDIHIEPSEKTIRIRYRLDGMLKKITEFPSKLHNSVVSRIKIMSKLDIAERRMPQDGKFYIKSGGEQYDFRVSCMPSVYGEKIVLRLLRVSNSTKKLEDLGFSPYNFQRMNYLLQFPYGIILLTGPTGSGKSTTLVGILNQLKDITKNIITVEDPVEYSIAGITQCQVQPEIGLNFARFLRAILRQDPDIIMVGEIRDKETAQLAIEASMTGHLVLSTLHTNSAAAAINRLLNLGIEPDLLGVSLLGVVGQRLVRTLCESCKTTEKIKNPEYLEMSNLLLPDREEYLEYKSVGCSACRKTGYRGRTGIHEVMIVDKKMRSLMTEGSSERVIEDTSRRAGMRTMFEDGFFKALNGITTIDEVNRVAINA